MGQLSTVDLLVLTNSDWLLLIKKILMLTTQLMRRSNVSSLSLQLVFPDWGIKNNTSSPSGKTNLDFRFWSAVSQHFIFFVSYEPDL
jgi:hypothetical protein